MMPIFFTNFGMGAKYGSEDVYAPLIFITQFMQMTCHPGHSCLCRVCRGTEAAAWQKRVCSIGGFSGPIIAACFTLYFGFRTSGLRSKLHRPLRRSSTDRQGYSCPCNCFVHIPRIAITELTLSAGQLGATRWPEVAGLRASHVYEDNSILQNNVVPFYWHI
jgi:hypothetical protein